MIDEVGDIAVCIGILCTAVCCQIRCLVVCDFQILKERIETVFLYHQQLCGLLKEVIAEIVLGIHLVEYNLSRRDRIILMVALDVINGQGHFCENTGRCLQLGATIV